MVRGRCVGSHGGIMISKEQWGERRQYPAGIHIRIYWRSLVLLPILCSRIRGKEERKSRQESLQATYANINHGLHDQNSLPLRPEEASTIA